MNTSILNGASWKVIAFCAMTLGAVAIPLLFIAVFVDAEPFPRDTLFGCYTSANAPALLIESDAIHIVEPSRRTFAYIAEPSKVSYQLNVRPALQLSPLPSGSYVFMETRGTGFFWSLLPVRGKNRDRIRHPNEFAGRFQLYARDGTRFIYSRETTAAECRDVL
ncbi:hypothetical protein [Croceicoccus marinus]|uniref:Uncharacterized protein n=1 Tax=Croceicoccus marinus TaxID=450378 RepID=A0A7G6VTE9_9SPHN|nr:hypothetical protein [Croceicoccus marinus]QNE05014.1 hypothetical protein H4O24_14070 [Croceicoccus marinus]